MSSVIVFLFVFGATMAFVGWPLVHPLLSDDEPSQRENKRKALLEEKDRLMLALRDLDHDHRTGKLDDADHASLSLRAKQQAAEVLREIDVNEGRKTLRPGDSPAATPEPVPVAASTAKVNADSPTIRVTHAELKAAAARETAAVAAAGDAARFCTKCGRPAKAGDDRFCGKCGATLPTD